VYLHITNTHTLSPPSGSLSLPVTLALCFLSMCVCFITPDIFDHNVYKYDWKRQSECSTQKLYACSKKVIEGKCMERTLLALRLCLWSASTRSVVSISLSSHTLLSFYLSIFSVSRFCCLHQHIYFTNTHTYTDTHTDKHAPLAGGH